MKKVWIFFSISIGLFLVVLGFGETMAWRNTGSYPVTLDNSNNHCNYPAMYNVDSTEFVTWQQIDGTDPTNWNIYFTWGSGTTWAPANPYQVTNNGIWGNNNNDNIFPDICARQDPGEGDNYEVFIAWMFDDTSSGSYEIETCRIIISINGGWPGVITSINYGRASDVDQYDSWYPAIDCGENVYLTWEDHRSGAEIYFDYSLDGFTWNTDQYWSDFNLNGVRDGNEVANSRDPCIAVECSGDTYQGYERVCVIWEDYWFAFPQLYYHVYYFGPTPNPESIGIVTGQVQAGPNLDPDIEDFDGEFLFVWEGDFLGTQEIFYQKVAFNANAVPTWGNRLRVTNVGATEEHPAIDVCENDFNPQNVFNEIHIIWDSDITGNGDIYACRGVQNPGGADTLSCSGQGGTDNRVSFTNNLDNYPDISCDSRDGSAVWQQNANPWGILYTVDP